MTITRNQFLKTLGISAAAAVTSASGFALPKSTFIPGKTGTTLKLGLTSYTLRKFSLDDVIKISKRLALHSVSLKSMHMPLEASTEEIKNIAAKVRDAGLDLYGAGVIYMKTAKDVETAFNYAAAASLDMIVGAPAHELLPQVNDLVKKFNIKVAIHNHGPGDDQYHSPSDVYAKVKDLDKRIGLCMDIGHVVRIGEDPAALIDKYKDRLLDMHMKDEDKAVADGKAVEVGRGIINIPAVVRSLKKANYQGCVAFEYEKEGEDTVVGLAESVGYVRGVATMIN
jgi:sugar phosphate isomerase/epimerase